MTVVELPPVFVACIVCNRVTTWREAWLRKFNTGRCQCGGELLS